MPYSSPSLHDFEFERNSPFSPPAFDISKKKDTEEEIKSIKAAISELEAKKKELELLAEYLPSNESSYG